MSQDTHNSQSSDKGAPAIVIVIVGAALIALGIGIQTQDWTRPEMFKGLDLDLSKVVVNTGVFLIFIQVLNIYFYAPLKEAMDERNSRLEKTFTDAEELRDSLTTVKADYEKRLSETEANARAEIQAQIKEAQNLRQTLMAEAATRADDLVRKAEQDIEAEKNKAVTEIRLHIVNLTLSATEKILGETVNKDVNARLVNEFIDRIEVAP